MLKAACLAGDVGAVRLLLDSCSSSSDVNQVYDDDGAYSPLIAASLCGHLRVVRLLVSKGADANRIDDNGCTSLYVASQHGHVKVVASREEEDNQRRSREASSPSSDCYFRADANKAAGRGCSPLCMASEKGHVDVVRLLLANGADVNHAKDDDGSSSLHRALSAARKSCDYCSRKQPAITRDGASPLCVACYAGCVSVARLLLKHGTDVNHLTRDEISQLQIACYDGYVDVVRLLIGYGADTRRADLDGKTPVDVARHYGHHAVVAQLLAATTRSLLDEFIFELSSSSSSSSREDDGIQGLVVREERRTTKKCPHCSRRRRLYSCRKSSVV
ncbi:hypothetical protein CTAYLR_004561 [Chrysophaeum taylorii]|uniref:Ankyrin repeat protein n=1 Tax=Chrysophaeum taylorii TaxID=2483200 RepID=A0AAD7XLS5_9STRA|nr:hypothetical protein CTAYLR_004561 [Chrysophaeum taylorii]